jgi:hypothetical protein
MACFETGTTIELDPKEAVTLTDIRGTTLRVARGEVWLTQERDPQDVVLRAGDSWVVERNGDTVIEAKRNARLRVIGRNVVPRESRTKVVSRWLTALTAWLGALERRRVPHY